MSGGGLSTAPNRLSATAFDLCFTAGPGEDVSVGSCRRLISPALTQAQLVDSTLWDFAKKLSGPRQINHWSEFRVGYHKIQPQCPVSLCLPTLNYRGALILWQKVTVCFNDSELWVTAKGINMY